MIRLLVSLFLLNFSSSNGLPQKSQPRFRIVGGDVAPARRFPYQVGFEYSDRHKCGGSIISKTRILTAAHCTEGRHASMIDIRAGSLDRELGGQLVKVKKYINHELYNNHTYDYDVAVLELEAPLRFNENVKAVQLPDENEPIKAKTATASGWGQLTEDEPLLPRKLMYVNLPIWKKSDCKKVMNASKRMLCAGYPEGGKDTCESDSGGPLVARGKQIGIVSWGYGCGRPNSPGVFINVAVVRKWIRENAKV